MRPNASGDQDSTAPDPREDDNPHSSQGLTASDGSAAPPSWRQAVPADCASALKKPSAGSGDNTRPERVHGPRKPCPASARMAQYSSQIPMRFQHDVPVPAVLRPGDAVLGGVFMLDVVQHMKDLAAAGEFFGNTSCTPCSGKNIYVKQMRFYCVEYRQKDPTAAKCAVRLQLRKLRSRPGWVVYKEGQHIHPALPQSKKSNRFKCLLRSLEDVDRDAAQLYTRRAPAAPWRGEAPLILPNLPGFRPHPLAIPLSAGPGGFIAPRAGLARAGLPAATCVPSMRNNLSANSILDLPAHMGGGIAQKGSGFGSEIPDVLGRNEVMNSSRLNSSMAPSGVNAIGGSGRLSALEVASSHGEARAASSVEDASEMACTGSPGAENEVTRTDRDESTAKESLTATSGTAGDDALPNGLIGVGSGENGVYGSPQLVDRSAARKDIASPLGPVRSGIAADDNCGVALESLDPPSTRLRPAFHSEDAGAPALITGSVNGGSMEGIGSTRKISSTVLKKARLDLDNAAPAVMRDGENTAMLEQAMALEERALLLEDRCFKMIVDAEKAVKEAGDNATPAMLARVKTLYKRLEKVQQMSSGSRPVEQS